MWPLSGSGKLRAENGQFFHEKIDSRRRRRSLSSAEGQISGRSQRDTKTLIELGEMVGKCVVQRVSNSGAMQYSCELSLGAMIRNAHGCCHESETETACNDRLECA